MKALEVRIQDTQKYQLSCPCAAALSVPKKTLDSSSKLTVWVPYKAFQEIKNDLGMGAQRERFLLSFLTLNSGEFWLSASYRNSAL